VRFRAEHHYRGPLRAVVALLADPTFYLDLDLPDLSRPELVEEREDGDDVVLRLRYEFDGNLDPMAARLIGSGRLAWIQEVRVDRVAGTGSLGFEAERDPRRLHGAADFVVAAEGAVASRASWSWRSRASAVWRSDVSCRGSCGGWISRPEPWTTGSRAPGDR
jgi:hypothetical protein